MGLDINKIIMKSIAEVENTTPNGDNTMSSERPYSLLESVAPAVPSAIAAGLGALTIVNRMRNIQESGDAEEGWLDKLGKMFTPKEVERHPTPDMDDNSIKQKVRNFTTNAINNTSKWINDNPTKTAVGVGAAGLAAGAGAMALAKRKQSLKK